MNKREKEENKRLKLPLVVRMGVRSEKTMILSHPPSQAPLPRLEKARSFITMPQNQQLILNKIVSVQLPTQFQYKSTFSLEPGLSRMEAAAASMNFHLLSTLKRDDNGETTSVMVKRKSSSSSWSQSHRAHKMYIMKAIRSDSTAKIIECAKQTSACSHLSRVVQTCLSPDCAYVYLIREYAAETLEDVFRRRVGTHRAIVPFRLLKSWLIQSLHGLDFLHNSMDICHSNLKPSNILVVASQIKLADWSVSRCARNRPYLPLETLNSLTYSPKSDIYSLGAIFCELLTARNTSQIQEDKIIRSLLKPISDRDEYLGVALGAMMSTQDVDRPTSNDLIGFLRFFDSIEILKRVHSPNSGCLVKFKNSGNDKKYLLKTIKLNRNNKRLAIEEISKTLVSHDNIIATNRHLIIEYHLYILREYNEEFVNLSQRINQLGSVNENILVQRWLNQIIDGLDHLHNLNIFHANLKPENILVRPKDDNLKLTDFGYGHLVNPHIRIPEFDSAVGGEYTKMSDVYLLGSLIFECMMECKSSDFDSLEGLKFSKRLKVCVKKMLDTDPHTRPDLRYLKSHLISPFYVDLIEEGRLVPILLDRKILNIESVDKHEFLAISSKKGRQHIGFSLTRVKFPRDNLQSPGVVEKVNFNSGLLLTRNHSSSSCSCSKYSQVNPDYPSLLPKVMHQVDASLLIGCNSNYVYFFDEKLKFIKRVCMLELLESRGAGNHHRRHSSMLKKHELKLEVNSICVDRLKANSFRIYLLLDVLQEVSILNVLKLDTSEFNRQSIFQSPVDLVDPNVQMESSIHLNILKPEFDKTIKTNQKYIFICERTNSVRVFSKKSYKYLYSLDLASDQSLTGYTAELFPNRIQDIDVDKRNGYIYAVYDYLIRVYDENCDLIWKFDITADLSWKLTKICLTRFGSMVLVMQDIKNEFSNKLFIFN